jgi:Ca2+-binding EF-hand superfamily protein
LSFDTNADGRITKAELDASLRTRFDGLDANKDGSVTRDEMQAAMQARLAENGKPRFANLDADANGQLSEAEFAAIRGRGPGPDGPRFRLGGRGGPGGPGLRPARGGPDADGNGTVTFSEFSARPTEAFARADANKDGAVTIAELQSVVAEPY